MDIPDRLLDPVLTNPVEDTPRLAVAAWLDEHGNESDRKWAEFIRLQLAPKEGDDPPCRERELRKQLNPRLMNGLSVGRDPIYHGGFIEGLTLSTDEFLAHIPTLVRRIPLRRLRLFQAYGSTTRLADVFQSPYLAQLCELYIRNGNLDLEALRQLTQCPFLSNLGSLTLQYADLGQAGARLLAESPVLKNLGMLHLLTTGIGDEGIACIAASEILAPVEDLSILGNRITGTGIKVFADSLSSRRLLSLNLWGNRIGTEGVQALMGATRLHNMERLFLALSDVDHEAIENWPSILRPSKLLWLDISGSNWSKPPKILKDAGLTAIAKALWMENLRVLHLTHNGIGSAGVEALAGSRNAKHLHTLGLGYNPIGDAGTIALARSPYLGSLRSLRIRNCKIGSMGARELASSATIGQLALLDVKENPIRAGAIWALRTVW